MDGFSEASPLMFSGSRQRSLRSSIGCRGIGLHTGLPVALTLAPAPAGSGIVFKRSDLGIDIPARYDRVVETKLCTVLADPERPEARVSTVEHLMAAFAGCEIDNAVVSVDAPELPVLDGSAADFLFLLDCAGFAEQNAARTSIEILRPVRVEDGKAFAELAPLLPLAEPSFELKATIEFDTDAIGQQSLALRLTPRGLRSVLARARTFALASEVETLRESGFAHGGNLENAIVVDGARVLNPTGLRYPDEFVRHKLLDAVGDLALAGARLIGRFTSHRGGHTLNNRVLHALFADRANWRVVSAEAPALALPPAAAA